MERLTKRVGEYVEIVGCKSLYSSEERGKAPASSAIARLAKYEDTGITPDEIKTLIAERDALLNDLRGNCIYCVYADNKIGKEPCNNCFYSARYSGTPAIHLGLIDNWKWRGIGGSDGT